MTRRPPRPTLFPSTPLSRSARRGDPRPAHALPHDAAPFTDPPAAHLAVLAAVAAGGPGRGLDPGGDGGKDGDRKSTRLNSSHQIISYAVFCLTKKTQSSAQQ